MNNIIYTLVSFFATGLCIGILFDIFRISRKAFKLPNVIIYIEDVLFWVISGLLVLFTIFTFTTGEIRLYMIIMMLLGTFVYFMGISKYFMFVNTKILEGFKHLFRIVLKPFRKHKLEAVEELK